MQRRHPPSPATTLWLFALALLLRAAMPFLATASADLQGRALGEVCSVYGVSLASHDTTRHDAPVAEHAGDHCVLQALGALGTTAAPPGAVAPPQGVVARPARIDDRARRHDPTATWVARRKHGPPPPA